MARHQRSDSKVGFASLYSVETYDPRDNLLSVSDQRSLQTSYVYSGLNDLIQTSSPDTGVSVYLVGNRTEETDARGVETNYAYDALNRVIS